MKPPAGKNIRLNYSEKGEGDRSLFRRHRRIQRGPTSTLVCCDRYRSDLEYRPIYYSRDRRELLPKQTSIRRTKDDRSAQSVAQRNNCFILPYFLFFVHRSQFGNGRLKKESEE